MGYQTPFHILGKQVWKAGGGQAVSGGRARTPRWELRGGRLQLKPQRPCLPLRKGRSVGTEIPTQKMPIGVRVLTLGRGMC